MSNPESFIDEVTEEVRREKLFTVFRKYGWIGIVLVLLVVGGAAWTEWQKARDRAASQAFGDAVLGALEAENPAARRDALAAVPADGTRAAILQLLLASDPAEDRASAQTALESVSTNPDVSQAYRDLALLRWVANSLPQDGIPVAERRAALESISAPGRAFRTMALEQLAYLEIEAGNTDAAITVLRTLTQDQEAPAGLRQRAQQMIVALGGEAEAG
ncbi:hypothetical protein GEU84_003280 [Fertoebacter nigrum]|uniref:Ancillary SecYEG translocon subunit/Cell division coordinator CpoB TPR domain-containing protein n=1 Tax=Fertoeibacter niger TaxID=2656921 RepID=A0A8X8H5I3_9RHOB|nr:hypothetical protein [Fertoeibacter niger]NUB43396.1 hypothetical protein [Fertoeibacter niger]